MIITSAFTAFAQFNYNWIDNLQKDQIYKIPVAESGVYRLTYDDLQSAGFPVTTIDPRWISIYHRGVEQAIIITGELDSNFDPEDYIEFYGEKNDGTLDSDLYITPEDQPHQYYNLYSDTTAYFLTWTIGKNGKRMEKFKKNNTGGLVKETFHWEEKLIVNTDEYSTGKSYRPGIIGERGKYDPQLTAFDIGEGWTGKIIRKDVNLDYLISGIENVVSAAKPKIEIQLVGRYFKSSHQVQIFVGSNISSLRPLQTVNFNLQEAYTLQSDIEWSDISLNGELLVRFNVQGVNGEHDEVSVNYLKLEYSQQWDMSGESQKRFRSNANGANESYFEINNTPANVNILDITDVDSPIVIEHNEIANGISFIANSTATVKDFYTYSTVLTPQIEKVEFQNYDLSEYDYAIISHKSLTTGTNPIQAYANYRASEIGGNYNVLVFDIDEVFNRYSFGEFSPLAIRKFLEQWALVADPRGLFLIGKSILIDSKSQGNYYRKNPESFNFKDLVPTAGLPGSDIPYGMGLNGDPNELDVPVGRLTASSPEQVEAYLDKIKESESAKIDALWKKNILHLSGGTKPQELDAFAEYVNGFKSRAEDLYLGGKVTSIHKQESNPVEFINATKEINNGLNLVTLFGHSGPGYVDMDIGTVSNTSLGYNNKGRYPVILVNGCNAGQVFRNDFQWGEDWILKPNLGALGFIAHSDFGYPGALRNYTNTFYDKAFGDSSLIYQHIGKIFQEVIRQYRSDFGTSALSRTQTEQMILLGDPALRMFKAQSPDYAVKNEDLFLIPYINGNINALVDSFAVGAIISNYGRADNDSIKIRIERTLEDNSKIFYDSLISPIYYQDTIAITIFNEDNLFVGENRFRLIIDYDNDITELNKENNDAVLDVNLHLNGTKNLFPSQFDVINNQEVNLILQTFSVTGQEPRDFLVEIDTLKTFDSPYKNELKITGEALLSTPFNLLGQDSLVYYWRTKFENPKAGENKDWTISSFTHIKNGAPGWMQSHYQQVDDDEFIDIDSKNGKLSFTQTAVSFDLKVYGGSVSKDNFDTIRFEIDGEAYMYPGRYCTNNAINLVTFSKYTGIPEPALNPDFWAGESCGKQPQIINYFTYKQIANSGTDSPDSIMLEQYLDNVREGDYVLMFTTGNIEFNNWSPELKAQIERIGGDASTIDGLGAGDPFILFGTKGAVRGTATEVVAVVEPFNEQAIALLQTVVGTGSSGIVKSTLIGPATTWQKFKNGVELSELTVDYNFDIYSVDYNGERKLEYENVVDREINLDGIDAVVKPFLQIELNLIDSVDLTASQLNYWQVEYVGVPESVLLLGENDQVHDLIKQEGDRFKTNFKFVNVSQNNYLTDSLKVIQRDVNKTFGGAYPQEFNIKSPVVGDTTHFSVSTDTNGKTGINDYYLDVNNYLEKEQHYDNNSLVLQDYFSVYQDTSNPLIQVQFDGASIENGAIVSATPLIETIVWDENPFLAITDTTGVQMSLKKDCLDCSFEPVYFSDDLVQWNIADLENRIDIIYQPLQLENGIYTLKVVAYDVTGNSSGNNPYEIQFQIINESSFNNFYVFPNPMSTGAKFSYQLTGSVIPDVLDIEILNIEGDVVKFISQKELGNIRFGNNVLDYVWDGTDNAGYPLSSGLYIYRLRAYLNGKNLNNQQSKLNNGIGKIYIIR